jgi:sulfopyruvate decarboxylase TPP-binding subunit
MKMKINKKHLGVVALLSATAAASVFAAGVTSTTQTSNGAPTAFTGRSGHVHTEAELTERKSKMTASLASALGTTVESITSQLASGMSPRDIIKASGLDEATVKAQLDASREADMKAQLAKDVASGTLTQAQADAILANKDNHHEGKGMGRGGNKENMLTNAASILGMTKETLQAEIASGKKLETIVSSLGMSESDFRTKMETLRDTEIKAKLAADVASGALTQAQADEMFSSMKNRADKQGFGGTQNKSSGFTTTK